MKILDVDLFQDGLRRNIAMLDRLGSEVETIHRAVEGLVAMEEELKGEGGSAIRAFYAECHLPLLQQFLVSTASYKLVLQQMESALDSLEPDTSGHIVEQFLEGEVEQGLTTIAQLTENLTNDSNNIMDQVSDIVALPHLDDSGVQEGVLDAKRKRDDTVSRLQEFDATQTAALLPFEQDMQAMDTWIRNMEEMFTSNLTDIHYQTDRWAELVACSRPLTISTPTIEGEMCLREEEEEKSVIDTGLEIVDGILSGLFDVGKDFVTGIVDIVQDPIATLDATLEAVTNPKETFNTIKSAITTSYERDMVNGDANSRAHWVTYALGTIATSVVGTKGVGTLAKSGVTVAKAVVPKVAATTKMATSSIANLLPYAPRPQLAMVGEVPYNVVNGSKLKDQLISMAKVESGVTGSKNEVSGEKSNFLGELMSPEEAKRYDDYWRGLGIGSNKTWAGFAKQNVNGTVEDYFKLVKEQSPWPDGFAPTKSILIPGDRIEMALSKGQDPIYPGRFATTTETITDVNYVREELAVKVDWKPEIDKVVVYKVKEGVSVPALKGPVGPQVDLATNSYLPGGADQVNIMLGREVNLMDYFDILSVRPIN